MQKLTGRRFTVFMILSVVVPFGLLTTLRATGVMPERKTISETLPTIEWARNVPNGTDFHFFDETIQKTYYGDNFYFDPRITIYEFVPSVSGILFIMMKVEVDAIVTESFIESVYMHLNSPQPCAINWLQTFFDFKNLSLIRYRSGLPAFAKLASVNHPTRTCFSDKIVWFFPLNSQINELQAEFEFTRYNGTVYKRIIQPFRLEISWN